MATPSSGPPSGPSSSPLPPAIVARGLTLAFGALEVLRGIDLVVPAGQSVALLGASGSGKSSLMAVLSGLERASSGAVSVAGLDFTGRSEDDLARARRGRIGVVLQSFHLLPTMTALENVRTPLDLAGTPESPPHFAQPNGEVAARRADGGAEARARAELEAVGLAHRLHHYPQQLSGGEQQRVAIARALAPRPILLFADEPTGNLDATTGAAIVDLLFARARETGATMILITHDEALAARAQRIVRLADGHIVADSAPVPFPA